MNKQIKYSVSFNIDKSNGQIYLYFSFNSKRLKYYTGYRIDPNKLDKDPNKSIWNIKKQRVKINTITPSGQTASSVNSELDKIEKKIKDIYEHNFYSKNTFTLDSLKKELKIGLGKSISNKTDFLTYFKIYIDKAQVSNGRKKQLQVTYNHFEKFLNNNSIGFDEVNPDLLAEFKTYLETDEVLKGKNTVISNLKRLRAFFKYAIDNDWTTNYPFLKYKIKSETYGTPIYITQAERDFIFEYDLSHNPKLSRVRDIFIFQCLIGARVGDLVELTTDNIINNKLTYIANKTKDEDPESVIIPLSEKAKTILSKYETTSGQLLPFITGQKYNDYLKELFEAVGITRNVQRINPTTSETETVRICDIASSHMARRTFVGALHAKKTKNEVIASMSGHKPYSKSFARYYNVSEELKEDAINNID